MELFPLRNLKLIIFLVFLSRFYRYVLRVVVRCDHVEHQSTQPQREGQTDGSEIHSDEQRHQRWRRPAGGPAQGGRSLLS